MNSELFNLVSDEGIVRVGPQGTYCKCGRKYVTIVGNYAKEEGDVIPPELWKTSKSDAFSEFASYVSSHFSAIYRRLPTLEVDDVGKYVVYTRLCHCGNTATL